MLRLMEGHASLKGPWKQGGLLLVVALLGVALGLGIRELFLPSPKPVAPPPTASEPLIPRAIPIPHSMESQATAGGLLHEINREYVEVLSRILPSVVNIFTARPVSADSGEAVPSTDSDTRNPRRAPTDEETSLGSGVILSPQGHILTNAHLVKNAREIRVQLFDGRRYQAKLLGLDEPADVAVLKVEAKGLVPALWGDSDRLEVGEQVFAVGNPFGLSGSVSRGIVSAKGRNPNLSSSGFENYIQTDAAINPGNSGGALINVEGFLVGINTAIYSRSGGSNGIGFAIPSKLARFAYESLVARGKVVRGFLGVEAQEVDEDMQQAFNLPDASGALVTRVEPNSPAAKAGIRRGDVIVRYHGMNVRDPAELRLYVSETSASAEIPIIFYRDGRSLTVQAQIMEQPEQGSRTEEGARWQVVRTGDLGNAFAGLQIVNLDESLRAQLGLQAHAAGVYVVDVEEGAPSLDLLQPGDVIEEIRKVGKPSDKVRNIGDLLRIAAGEHGKEPVLFYIRRGGAQTFVLVRP